MNNIVKRWYKPALFYLRCMMQRNKAYFTDICKGVYGRKVAYTGVKEITTKNVLDVISKTIGIHYWNRGLIDYLYRYYKGDQPILYREKTVRPEINNKVSENHALEVVRFKASQTYGEPIQYVCKKKDSTPEMNAQVDLLNDYLDEADAEARNIVLGTYQSAVGTAYKAVLREDDWTKDSDISPFRIVVPYPGDVYVVYSAQTGKAMLSVQILKDEDNQTYYQCFSKDQYFIIKNGQIQDFGINGFDGIPVIEYPNNHDRLSDVEIAINLFDAMNKYQSDRLNGVEQFVQAFMKFKNCEIDETEFAKLVELGAISVKDTAQGMQSDVELMTAELNQTENQVAKDDIYNNMLIVEGMPNREQSSGGSTGQAIYLSNGWEFAERRASLDEPLIRESEKQFARIILNIISKTTKDISITTRDFDVKISRNSTDNMLVKAQTLDYLFKNKIDPLTALTTCGLFSDPQKVYELSIPYVKEMYAADLAQGETNHSQSVTPILDTGASVTVEQ